MSGFGEGYGFTDPPFHVTPDTRFLFPHRGIEGALERLAKVVAEGKGFAVVTGEVGAGKTTLLRAFLERLPVPAETAVLFQTDMKPEELLHEVATELGADAPPEATRQRLVEVIRDRLLALHAEGKTVVLLIDEAQNIPLETLESVRMLSNLETEREKLMQIILFGQTELSDLLARPEARQIRTRIAERIHLGPLTPEETGAYLAHRIQTASPRIPVAFTPQAARAIHRATGGVPRLVNLVADRALERAAEAEGGPRPEVTADDVAAAAKDHPALAAERAPSPAAFALAGAAAALVVAAGLAAWVFRSPSTHAAGEGGARVDATHTPRPAVAAEAPAPARDESRGTTTARWLSLLGASGRDLALLAPEAASEAAGFAPVVLTVETDKIGALALPALLLPQPPFLFDRPAILLEARETGLLLDLPDGIVEIRRSVLPERLRLLYAAPREKVNYVPLAAGAVGPRVEALEKRLVALGLLSERYADRLYGNATVRAVRTLQETAGIRRDGIYGPETSIALYGLEKSTSIRPPSPEGGAGAAERPPEEASRRGT